MGILPIPAEHKLFSEVCNIGAKANECLKTNQNPSCDVQAYAINPSLDFLEGGKCL